MIWETYISPTSNCLDTLSNVSTNSFPVTFSRYFKSVLIPEETRVLTVSRSGYAKTQPLDEYREQRRGGQGKAAASVKEEDLIQNLYVLSSHVQILCFTTKGKVFWLKVFDDVLMIRSLIYL